MKRVQNLIVILLLVLTLATSLVVVSSFLTPEEEPDVRFLRAVGQDFVNEEGEKVFLKGINAGGLFVQEEWMTPVTSKDTLTTLKVLRERFGWENAEALMEAYQDAWWHTF